MSAQHTGRLPRLRLELRGGALAAHYASPAFMFLLAATSAGWNREEYTLIAFPWAAGTFLIVGVLLLLLQRYALYYTPIRTTRTDARNREIVVFMAKRIEWIMLPEGPNGEVRFRTFGFGNNTLVTVQFESSVVYVNAISQSRGRIGMAERERKQVAEALEAFD